MKLHTETATLHRGGVNTEQTFTIAAKGKAFEILSSGLYTDPMLAIVRELCCNARDSHIANGNVDTPFQVHLPNNLEPFFEVTDYGLGLSEHDVFHIFTTYFESTKDESDDFIGCLGLGSKSPFSYSDAFEVVSRFNGIRTIYSMFKNEVGVPSVAKMAEQPTIEPNGVSVKITVKVGDFHVFKRNLASALKYFETKPEVVGYPGFEFDEMPKDPIRGDDWFVSSSAYNRSPIICVQGGVGYKVDISNVCRTMTDAEQNFTSNMHLVLYFNIGDIDIPPSREEVRYDEKTVANIVAAIRKCRAELTAKIEERLVGIDGSSRWKAYIKLNDYGQENFSSFRGMSHYVDHEQVKNPLLADFIKTDGTLKVELGHPGSDKNPVPVGDGGLKTIILRDYKKPRYGATRMTRYTPLAYGKHEIKPSTKTVVVLFDEKARAVMKLSDIQATHRYNGIYVIVPNDYKTFATDPVAQAEYAGLLDKLGNPDVVKISDHVIEDTSPALAKQKQAKKTYWYKFGGMEQSTKAQRRWTSVCDTITWDKTATDDPEAPTSGLYFMVKAHRNILSGDNVDSRPVDWVSGFRTHVANMIEMINTVKGTTYSVDDVWGAQTGLVTRKLVKDPNWTNVFALAAECLDYVKDASIVQARITSTDHFLKLDKGFTDPKLLDRINNLSPTSEFRKIIQPLLDIDDKTMSLFPLVSTARDVDRAINGLNNPMFPKKNDVSYAELYREADIYDAYPMLTFADGLSYSDLPASDKVFAYINLIDEQK